VYLKQTIKVGEMHNSKYLDQWNKTVSFGKLQKRILIPNIKFWVRHPLTWLRLQKVLQMACLSQLFISLTLIFT